MKNEAILSFDLSEFHQMTCVVYVQLFTVITHGRRLWLSVCAFSAGMGLGQRTPAPPSKNVLCTDATGELCVSPPTAYINDTTLGCAGNSAAVTRHSPCSSLPDQGEVVVAAVPLTTT